MQNLDRIVIILLFSGYVGKLLAFGAGLPDAAVVLVLAAAHFLNNSNIQNKELSQLKQELSKQQETLELFQKEHLEMKNAVAGVKITQGLRNVR
tara:strand:- start:1338 stop:1619 length:282 start_codon:yes stop_codon:yes gene_type:complete